MQADMDGKVCVVTGASSGIGRVTALGLAERGATVVLICRNEERGAPVLEEIERRYSGFGAYSRSKLANILFTHELSRRLEGTGVTANCLHPGVVATGIFRNLPGWLRMVFTSPLVLSPEKGADTMLYLATAPEVAEVSGRYFVRRKPVRSSRVSQDAAAARRLWEASEALTAARDA